MEKRKLGSQGLEVTKLGVGCMNLTHAYASAPTEAQGMAVIARALELGITFFDTAEMYGPFTNEVLVGKGLRAVRDKVVIATKFGFRIPEAGGRPEGVNSRPDHIRAVCDASLQRLGIETIDLFYQHRVDPDVPIEDVAGTVGDLVREGKVRFFGMSEAAPATLRRAHAVHPVSALQSEYSLWMRDMEDEVLPTCRELGVGFVAYSPLGRGFLGGTARTIGAGDFRLAQPRFQGDALAANLCLLDRLDAIAADKHCTTAQLALAWLLHQGEDIVPIPGTGKVHRLEENMAAANISLSADDLAALDAAMPRGAAVGDRYDPVSKTMVQR